MTDEDEDDDDDDAKDTRSARAPSRDNRGATRARAKNRVSHASFARSHKHRALILIYSPRRRYLARTPSRPRLSARVSIPSSPDPPPRVPPYPPPPPHATPRAADRSPTLSHEFSPARPPPVAVSTRFSPRRSRARLASRIDPTTSFTDRTEFFRNPNRMQSKSFCRVCNRKPSCERSTSGLKRTIPRAEVMCSQRGRV